MTATEDFFENTFEEVLLARQPIYNKDMGVYAYELLFRSKDRKTNDIDADDATSEVLMNAFLTMDLEELVGPIKLGLIFQRNICIKQRNCPCRKRR